MKVVMQKCLYGYEMYRYMTFLAFVVVFALGVSILYIFQGVNITLSGFKDYYSLSPSLRPKQHVLLVTYGRSGSTFTSAIINHHEDVFFVFEPLYVLYLDDDGREIVTSSNSYNKQNESVAIINSFLSCDLPAHHAFALSNFQLRNSDAMKPLYHCLSIRIHGADHVACYIRFLDSCRSHETVLVKTIRFRVKWAETFLEKNPNFKLLYLVRDPRATLLSQARVFGNFNWRRELSVYARYHCGLLSDDLEEAERLAQLFPGRVIGLRYEHGATDPEGYARRMYTFLGLGYGDETEGYVRNITNAPHNASDVDHPYSVARINSTASMDRWRHVADYRAIHMIDDICGYLYPKLGYRTVYSKEDLTSSRSLVDTPQSPILQI